MSRRGEVGYPVHLMGKQNDWGGTLALPDGTVYRSQPAPFYETPLDYTDGHTALFYIGAGGGFRGQTRVHEGDLIILANMIGSNTTAISEPTNYDGNPWTYIKAYNGLDVNFVATGQYGSIRLRMSRRS